MDLAHKRYEELERQILAAHPDADVGKIRAAFEYANEHHGPQLRKSGEPYIIHPIAVAEIVNELELDQDSIIAALLHDVIEDTPATHEDVAHRFSPTVADLVEGVTLYHKQEKQEKDLAVEGVFIAVGMHPGTEAFAAAAACDEKGYLIAGEDCATNLPGVFAAGDIRTKPLRQIVTAVADGANAAEDVAEYLIQHG